MKLLLISSSLVHGYGYLEQPEPEIKRHFAGAKRIGFIPFQINGHYLDPDPNSTHKGETREDRLREFHEENEKPVVGLREGTMLLVEGNSYKLLGLKPARVFRRGKEPIEVSPGMRLD